MKRLTRIERARLARKPRGTNELPQARPRSVEQWRIAYALHVATELARKVEGGVVDLMAVEMEMEEDDLLLGLSDEGKQWLFTQVWMIGPFVRRPSDLAMVLSEKGYKYQYLHPGPVP